MNHAKLKKFDVSEVRRSIWEYLDSLRAEAQESVLAMHCQDLLHTGPLCGHQGQRRISLVQQLRSRGGFRSLCRRRLLPRAEAGQGGSSSPALILKPSLNRPPQRPPPPSQSEEEGNQTQDRPPKQASGGANRRQDSVQEGSGGNGKALIPTLNAKWIIKRQCLTYSCSSSEFVLHTSLAVL